MNKPNKEKFKRNVGILLGILSGVKNKDLAARYKISAGVIPHCAYSALSLVLSRELTHNVLYDLRDMSMRKSIIKNKNQIRLELYSQ